LATDGTMRALAKQHRERKYPVDRGLRLSRADKIGDVGVKAAAEAIGARLKHMEVP
jgi:hypothetical protein